MASTPDRVLDELLVLKCRTGDVDAFGLLVQRWDRRLRSHAWYLTHDREVTKDIVQETWLEIISSIHRLKVPAAFRGWAFRIVSNKAADWIRRQTHQRAVQIEAAQNQSVDLDDLTLDVDEKDISQAVRVAIRALPASSQQILSMKYLDRMSTREIARVLDIPEGTVKSRLYHARDRLKQILERRDS